MPKISAHKKEDVYNSIMGRTASREIDKEVSKAEEVFNPETTIADVSPEVPDPASVASPPEVLEPASAAALFEALSISPEKPAIDDSNKYVHKSYYITKRQERALKIRAANSANPDEKDLSAIVRTALNVYLADTLKDMD